MKKVIVKNNQGIETHGVEMIDPTEWVQHCIDNDFWGKKEIVEVDENGNLTGVIVPAEYTVEIIDFTHEHAMQECIQNRIKEYPTPLDFMNSFFDGGEVALQQLQELRLAIKAKYPKPVKE
jgi:hypothetical protein